MSPRHWGMVGFGEAGSAFARHISKELGGKILVTDPLLNESPPQEHVRSRLRGLDIEIIPDVPRLVARCDVVLSLVTPRAASEVATQAAAAEQQTLFIDFNSVSPLEKKRLASLFQEESYVDGSILGSIAGEKACVQLALSGPQSDQAHSWLAALGFRSSVISSKVGAAAVVKMCRSIFMKGVECLFVETMMAASRFDVTESVLQSIEGTFTSYGLKPLANMLVTTHAAHCGRRSDEMQGVAEMLKEMKLPSTMSGAARDFLRASNQAHLTDHFARALPEHQEEVIEYLTHYYQEKL